MKKLISTLLLVSGLLFATACTTVDYGTTNPIVSVPFERSQTMSSGDPYRDSLSIFAEKQKYLTTVSKVEIRWDAIPSSEYQPEVRRMNGSCEIALREAYAIDELVLPCEEIADNGDLQKIFYVYFYDENDQKKRFEFTAMEGSFTKNGHIENGYLGGRIRWSDVSRQPREIVWSTEDPQILNFWRNKMLRAERRMAREGAAPTS